MTASASVAAPPAGLKILALVVLLLLGVLCGFPAQAQTLHYLGQQVVPHGFEFAGTTVGGLSGLDYDAATQRFAAISDDRSERQAARYYTLELDLTAFNTREEPGYAGVRFVAATTLKDATGNAHAPGTVDPEAIRFAGKGSLWWTSEGHARNGIPPAVEEVGADGTALRRLGLPEHVLPGPGRGVRHNLAFESLARLAGKLYIGTENALFQDGPEADLDQPSPARILVFDAGSGARLAEYVYPVDAVPVAPPIPGLYRTNGLVELLGGDGVLLALERSYVLGVGNGARIYRLDLSLASDVAGLKTLKDAAYQPVAKSLVLDLASLGIPLDNLEGMSWGPRLPDGRRTLILVADDNFSARQRTLFLAFAVEGLD